MEEKEEVNRGFSPYFTLFGGIHNIQSDDYTYVFDHPLFRYGGGFGMRFGLAGFEIMARGGSSENTITLNGNPRIIYLSETDIQLRLYGLLNYSRFTFPMGIGVGLLNMTADRGYADNFDRFNGRGLYVGPFVGIEYPLTKNITFALDFEYSVVGEAEFERNEYWNDMYYNNIEGLEFPNDAPDFWDTVGGDNDEIMDVSGFLFTARVIVHIPRYKQKKP